MQALKKYFKIKTGKITTEGKGSREGSESTAGNISHNEGRQDKGFIQFIVIIIISLVVLRLLGISITDILDKPMMKEFFVYIKDILKLVWEDLLMIFRYFKAA